MATGIETAIAAKWIQELAGKLLDVGVEREASLQDIADRFVDPRMLSQAYVEPDCQQFNPADHHEDEPCTVVRQAVGEYFSQFLGGAFLIKDGRNQLIVLSDAGMGKTSLIVMLRLAHITRFLPSKIDTVLLKIGPDTLAKIRGVVHPSTTILLLDALDEDAQAWDGAAERLNTLLRETSHFRQVIITCRTQFFAGAGRDPLERTGRVVFDGFVCPLIYLSPFNDRQVAEFLQKSFKTLPLKERERKLHAAQRAVASMKSLRMRPMLLAHIQDLVQVHDRTEVAWTEYFVYRALVQMWLLREQRKPWPRDRPKPSLDDLWQYCMSIAAYLHSTGRQSLSEADLATVLASNSAVSAIATMDVGGRSLLTRNSDSQFRFSHYSIQEFLVAHQIIEGNVKDSRTARLRASGLVLDFLLDWMKSGREKNVVPQLRVLDFRGAQIQDRRFSETSFAEVRFDGARMMDVVFDRCNFSKASFSSVILDGVKFIGCNMKGTSFRRVDARSSAFKGCEMHGADLTGASLIECSFEDSALDRVDITGSDLTKSHIVGCELRRCKADDANLTGVVFSKNRVATVSFRRASFRNANVIDADLSSCNLLQADFGSARWSKYRTKWPYGFLPPEENKSFEDRDADRK